MVRLKWQTLLITCSLLTSCMPHMGVASALQKRMQGGLDAKCADIAVEQYLAPNLDELGLPGARALLTISIKLRKLISQQPSRMIDVALVRRELERALEVVATLQDTRTTFRVTRRLLLSNIFCAQRLLGDLWSADMQALTQAMCEKFFQWHVRASASKRVVQMFHVSKSGGSTTCQIAEANGCSTQDFSYKGNNCRVDALGDFPIWGVKPIVLPGSKKEVFPWYIKTQKDDPKRRNVDCSTRYQIMQDKKWNFYENELWLPGGGSSYNSAKVCTQFVNMIVLRDPVDRLMSHLRHLSREYWRYDSYMSHDAVDLFKITPQVTNNYYIRSLLGQRTFFSPLGSIGQKHLQAAKHKLQQFDVTIILEDEAQQEMVVRYSMGWGVPLSAKRANDHTEQAPKDKWFKGFPEKEQRKVIEMSRLDMVLYDYARKLARVDTLFFDVIASLDKLGRLSTEATFNISSLPCGYVSLSGEQQSSVNASAVLT